MKLGTRPENREEEPGTRRTGTRRTGTRSGASTALRSPETPGKPEPGLIKVAGNRVGGWWGGGVPAPGPGP